MDRTTYGGEKIPALKAQSKRAYVEAGGMDIPGDDSDIVPAKAAPERRWIIQKQIDAPFDSVLASIVGPAARSVEVVEARALEEAREALADTGMKLALMVDALAEQGQDPSELERELLNPIQRALGAHESSTSPRSGGGR